MKDEPTAPKLDLIEVQDELSFARDLLDLIVEGQHRPAAAAALHAVARIERAAELLKAAETEGSAA